MELGWDTDRDIEPFLAQPELVSDHLRDHVELIRSLETDEEKHAVIWGVSNLVPLKQFQPGELNIVYYENLCIQPEVELQAIFKSLGLQYDPQPAGRVDQPSQTSRATSAVVTGSNKISQWKNGLRLPQIDRILRIVQNFGLDHLYGDSLLPLDSGQDSQIVT
jgi:hypothetical protein